MPASPLPEDPALPAELAELARRRGGTGSPEVMHHRHGRIVLRCGDVVVRWSPDDAADPPREALAAGLPEALPMLGSGVDLHGGRATAWPYAHPVEPDAPPWEQAGALLARLHRRAPPPDAPPWLGTVRLARIMRRLPDDAPGVAEVRRAHATLPEWVRSGRPHDGASEASAVVHGDWHLGQMVCDAAGEWRLIDLDSLGCGDPAWDLARPAGLLCADLLDQESWQRFVAAYRRAGGPAGGTESELWASMELPARTLVVQMAATRLVNARSDHTGGHDDRREALVEACLRIARWWQPACAESAGV